MTPGSKSNRVWVWGVVALLALGGAAAYWFGVALPVRHALAAMPVIEAEGMEPQVAAKLKATREATRKDPRSASAWGRLGEVFHAHDLLTEAVTCYDQAAKLDPDAYRWAYLAALAYRDIDSAEALPYFERAASLRKRDPALHIRFGETLVELGQMDRARRQFERALEADERSSHALYGLGQVAWLSGDVDEALAQLNRAAELAPRHGEVHTLLSQVYQRRGDTARAQRELTLARSGVTLTRPADPTAEAMEAAAVSSRAYTDRGVRWAREQKYEEAEQAFRRVLEIRPGNVRDHANLGGVLLRQDRHAEALEQFNKAVEVMPEDVDALSGLGLTLAEMGRTDEAVRPLMAAVRIDPNASGAHHNLGRLRFAEGKVADAIEHYEAALQSDPQNGGAHSDLAVALAGEGRLDEAVPHWQRAIELDRFDLASRLSLSMAQSRLGRHGDAIRLLREGLSIAPNSSRFVSMLAWELATAPRKEDRDGLEAVLLARRVYEARPDSPEAADVLAAALAETGAFDEAELIARQGLERATAGGPSGVADGLRLRLQRYSASRPFRQP